MKAPCTYWPSLILPGWCVMCGRPKGHHVRVTVTARRRRPVRFALWLLRGCPQ